MVWIGGLTAGVPSCGMALWPLTAALGLFPTEGAGASNESPHQDALSPPRASELRISLEISYMRHFPSETMMGCIKRAAFEHQDPRYMFGWRSHRPPSAGCLCKT